ASARRGLFPRAWTRDGARAARAGGGGGTPLHPRLSAALGSGRPRARAAHLRARGHARALLPFPLPPRSHGGGRRVGGGGLAVPRRAPRPPPPTLAHVEHILHYHEGLLRDRARNAAFHRALAARIRPGHHVLDVGTGSGLWAVVAARLGA